jgi:hypothetical protein
MAVWADRSVAPVIAVKPWKPGADPRQQGLQVLIDPEAVVEYVELVVAVLRATHGRLQLGENPGEQPAGRHAHDDGTGIGVAEYLDQFRPDPFSGDTAHPVAMAADGVLGLIVDGKLKHRRHAVGPNQSGRILFKGRRRHHADRFVHQIRLPTGAVHQAPRMDVVSHCIDCEIPLQQIGFDGWMRKGRDVDEPGRRCDPQNVKRVFPQIDDPAAGFCGDLSGDMTHVPGHHQIDVCRRVTRKQVAYGSPDQIDPLGGVGQEVKFDVG